MDTPTLLREAGKKREAAVQTILTENRSWKTKYKDLVGYLDGNDPRKRAIAENTLMVMQNQARMMEAVRSDPKLEATFSQALGQLVPKVVDLVRIFYPNLIAHDLVDVQPMDRQNGEIFLVQPVYTNSAAGVTAGQQIFQHVTDGTYASEKTVTSLGTGDNSEQHFGASVTPVPIRPNTVVIRAGTISGTDNGLGAIAGTGIVGTVDYATGAIATTFTVPPANLVAVTASFRYDSEQTPSLIRSVDIRLSLVPITAEPHPLRINWSTQAELAASAHLNLNIPETLANLAASFIKQERDIDLVNLILASAAHDSNLDFSATPPANYSRLARYAEIELKLNYAESQIQRALGRGGISWVLAGTNASDIWRNCNGFEPSDVIAPIGPHKIGTLRDGTVAVIKVPSMAQDTYVVGFKGYTVGDASAILAEWVPLYATPVWMAPDLSNQQGMASFYQTLVNQAGYWKSGTVSGYTA